MRERNEGKKEGKRKERKKERKKEKTTEKEKVRKKANAARRADGKRNRYKINLSLKSEKNFFPFPVLDLKFKTLSFVGTTKKLDLDFF